jgi:hypothetical protein
MRISCFPQQVEVPALAELAELVEQQQKEDVYTVSRPNGEISLDSVSDAIGYDPMTGEIIDLRPSLVSPLGQGEHGTLASYRKRGCKCRPCRDANAAHLRDYRARKKASA